MSFESADDRYEAIRCCETDIQEIAAATGLRVENIAKVKQHFFLQTHWLDKYVMLEVPGEWKRFDSSVAIADSWQRLRTGKFTPEDLQLLRHEIAEARYMRKHGPNYLAAYTAAQQLQPAQNFNY